MKKNIVILAASLLCFNLTESKAQFKFSNLFGKNEGGTRSLFEPHSTVSFGAGAAQYLGELNPYGRTFAAVFNPKSLRWGANFTYTRYMSPTFSARVGLSWIRVSGDDNQMDGVKGYEVNFIRNLHFRNDIKELMIAGQYDFIRGGRSYHRREALIPYIFGGLAVFAHDPVAKADPINTTDGVSKWERLQPLRTEAQGLGPNYDAKPYSLVNLAIPLGFGIRKKMNESWDLGVEAAFRYTFSDYIDDVGGKYADPNDLNTTKALSAAMGNRTLERTAVISGKGRADGLRDYLVTNINTSYSNPATDPFSIGAGGAPIPGFGPGEGRGSSKLKDSYMTLMVSLIYHIPPKIKCPPLR
jgi:Domain of unknown function (DUF6089)